VTAARFDDVPDVARSYLTIAEAAAACGRHPRRINKWIKDGRLRAITVAGIRLVPKREALDVERDTRQAGARGRPRRAENGEELAS
jgi:excisionase family DNA binding protein